MSIILRISRKLQQQQVPDHFGYPIISGDDLKVGETILSRCPLRTQLQDTQQSNTVISIVGSALLTFIQYYENDIVRKKVYEEEKEINPNNYKKAKPL